MNEETIDPRYSGGNPSNTGARSSEDARTEVTDGESALSRLAVLFERIVDTASSDGRAGIESEPAAEPPPGWRRPELSDKVLQQVRFGAPRSAVAAAYRVLQGKVEGRGESGLLMSSRSRVSFDTYLNSFYENYWSRHAPLDAITLRIFGVGSVAVQVLRSMPDGASYEVARARMVLNPDEGGTVEVPLDPSHAGSGRLHFTVDAANGPATILGARFETEASPRRPVRFGLGLCTFNREAMLAANLGRIIRSDYYAWAAPTIVIVNQGKPFASEEMRTLLSEQTARIRVVEQANFGGAGGFTRAAMELVRQGEATHVLFMDDDIEIDPEVLTTTHAFAARTTKPTVIGGAMVDLFRPLIMYEAGAVVSSRNILKACLSSQPLNNPATLRALSREVPCHFNGWWYCAIPTEMFRDHGLPLPIFIRGDDMEYGVRLMNRGVPTVVLPPISVWHEPFYAKAPTWQLYYDLRNRLIFASNNEGFVHLDPPSVILRRLIDSLLKHDYMHADLVIRAVEDFLAGPQILDTPMDVLHAEISALAAERAPAKLQSALGLELAPWREQLKGPQRALTLVRGLVNLYRGRIEHRLRPDLVYLDQWHPWMTMRVSQYAVADRSLSFVQAYTFDRDALRDRLRRGRAILRRYKTERAEAAGRWRQGHGDLSSWQRWERILGLEPKPALPRERLAHDVYGHH